MKRIICNLVLLLLFSCNAGVEVEPQVEDPPDENFTVPTNPLGNNLFVSLDGDDSLSYGENDIDHPWASIARGMEMVQPGDILYIRNGRYTAQERLCPGTSGTEDLPIIIRGESHNAIIEGTRDKEEFRSPLYIEDVSWISIENLSIRYGGHSAVMIGWDRVTEHITVENCRISGVNYPSNDNPSAIYINSNANEVLIKNNEIFDCSSHGITMMFCGNVTIENNFIHDLRMDEGAIPLANGIFPKHQPYGTILIRNNYLNNISGYGFSGNIINSEISNNIFSNIGDTGIMLICTSGGQQYMNDSLISHNTVVYCGIAGINIPWDSDVETRRNSVENNLIAYNCPNTLDGHNERKQLVLWTYGSAGEDPADRNSSDYNCYYYQDGFDKIIYFQGVTYSVVEYHGATGFDTHSIQGAPQFLGGSDLQGISDFALTDGSPGRGAASDGSDMGVDVSLVGIDANN